MKTLDNIPLSASLLLPGKAMHVPLRVKIGRASMEIFNMEFERN